MSPPAAIIWIFGPQAGPVKPHLAPSKPDLQGVWDFRTVTPLERPAEFKDKPFLTEQEVIEYEKKQVAARSDKTTRRTVKRDRRDRRRRARVQRLLVGSRN